DQSIVQAARVSYAGGTKTVREDRGLIRYLLRHDHTTPFEMVVLKFHIKAPIFVVRQWLRHRTACLAEGTEIYFDLPGGIKRRGNQLYKLKIEEIWDRFQATQNTSRPDRQGNAYSRRDEVRKMHLRQVNEETLQIGHTRVVGVYRNGKKPVFRMTLADGKQITSTTDHRFLFVDGWHTLVEATGLHEQNGMAVWHQGDHYLYVNGQQVETPTLYQEKEWLNIQFHVLGRTQSQIARETGVTSHTIRKWVRKHNLQAEKGRGDFKKGSRPWNQDKTYSTGPRTLSPAARAAIVRSRSRSASNFWRGGVSTERESIGRWTTEHAHKVHLRNGWTCQLCFERASELHAHHIVPVWADRSLAYDINNLTTLCGPCHRQIGGCELEYVERLGGPPSKAEWQKRPRVAWNKLTVAKLVRVESFEYVGERETYDLEVEDPYHNFIANGIVTHNSVNEESARYSIMKEEFHEPAGEEVNFQSKDNKQGRSADPVPPEVVERFLAHLKSTRETAYAQYEGFLEDNIAREIARMILPLSVYTQFYWQMNLHNLFHFLRLRMDPHAQKEIRDLANQVAVCAQAVAPVAWEAFEEYKLHGKSFSRSELALLRRLLEGEPLPADAFEGSKSLLREFEDKLGMKVSNQEPVIHSNGIK
ncbi:MAG: FAD-dependent thymidylate synthase, partial [Chloroflexia bacterium]